MNQDLTKNYAKAFRILRAAFGLRQAELAGRLSVGPSHLSRIEAGDRLPSRKTVDELAVALGVPRALVALLASEPGELAEDVPELAQALLRLLVSASDEQATLPFGGKE